MLSAAWIVLSACSPESVDVATLDGPDLVNVPIEFTVILGSERAAQLADLQIAIDTAVEQGVSACMQDEGFRYTPRSQADLLAIDKERELAPMLAFAQQALDYLMSEPSEGTASAERTELEGLSPLERDAWLDAENQCFVNISQQHENPLVEEDSWFDDASEEASSRTAIDPRILEAERDLAKCSSGIGYGGFSETIAFFSNEALAVLQKEADGTVRKDQAVRLLTDLAAVEADIAMQLEGCLAPFQSVERETYARHLAEIADRDADRFALWAADVEGTIDTYADLLPTKAQK